MSAPLPTVDRSSYRSLMGSWVTGVSLITATAEDGRAVGCTLNALTSLSLEPPSLLISLGDASRTLAALQASGRFCVNVLASDQERVARIFADGGLTAEERFSIVEHATRHEVPVIEGTRATLVCDVSETIPIHDHVVIAGRVVHGEVDDEQAPLVFFCGAFDPPQPPVTR